MNPEQSPQTTPPQQPPSDASRPVLPQPLQPDAPNISPSSPATPPAQPSAQNSRKKMTLIMLAVVAAVVIISLISLAIAVTKLSKPGSTPTASSPATSAMQTGGGDKERREDVQQLQSYLEAYGYDHHKYPTFADVNDPTFRKTVFAGLEDRVFQDPEGTSTAIANTPQTKIYAYSTTPATCDNAQTACTAYVLTAVLSTGQKWKLESFGL